MNVAITKKGVGERGATEKQALFRGYGGMVPEVAMAIKWALKTKHAKFQIQK